MTKLETLAMSLNAVPDKEGKSFTIPVGGSEPWFQLVVTQVNNAAEAYGKLENQPFDFADELTSLEKGIHGALIERISMALWLTEKVRINSPYQTILLGKINVYVALQPTEHCGCSAIERTDFFSVQEENSLRHAKALPTLKISNVEYIHDSNEETHIIPYDSDMLFYQHNSKHPQLKMLSLFSLYRKENVDDIIKALDSVFGKDPQVKVYFVPSGIAITDVFNTILITL